jgi:hypothetical protein
MEDKYKDLEKRSSAGVICFIIVVLVVITLIIMGINSRKPGHLEFDNLNTKVRGAAFIKANEMLIKQISDNWQPNDLFWPTALLDNMPSFQIGELEVLRYNIRVLRDNLSRMRTTDKLEPSAEGAFTALSNDPYKWWFPSAESKWQKAYDDLGEFYEGLVNGTSHFYPRADNLVELLNQYVSLMGGVNTRLINAPKRREEVLAMEEEVKTGPKGSPFVQLNIPWHKIDDNFYYAQGAAFALYESFKAIRIDFIEVLKDKNSVKLVDKIIEGLETCQFEPLIVFNGATGSVFANHSLNLSGMFNDARQKVYSLIVSLREG